MADRDRHLRLKRGDSGVYNIPVTNADGSPVPLPAGLKVWFTAKSSLLLADDAAEVAVGTANTGRTGVEVIDANGGLIQVQVAPEISAVISAYVLQYDCQIEGNGIPRMTIDEGFMYVTDQVTQSS